MNGWWVDPNTGAPLAYKNQDSPPQSRPDAVFVGASMPSEADVFVEENTPYKWTGTWVVDQQEKSRRDQKAADKAAKKNAKETARTRLENGQGAVTRQDIDDLLLLLS